MLITKQVQNHQFKRNKLHHSSFLLKEQGYLAKLNDFSICNHYSSSTQTPKKRSQWNTRAKSAYSKKNKSNIDQRKSLRPTTSTKGARQQSSKTVFTYTKEHNNILNEHKILMAKTLNVNNFDSYSIDQRMACDHANKKKIEKKLNQIISIATKGKIIKTPKQRQKNLVDKPQHLFVNDKLKQLLISQKISSKTYRFVKGFNVLQKRGRKQLKKKTQQNSTFHRQVTIGNQEAFKVENICRGAYVSSDISQYLTIEKFNSSRQEFATLEQYYKRSKQQYKRLKNEKVNINTNEMQPLQRELKKGSMLSVVYLNEQAERINEARRDKFLKYNNFI